MEIKWYGQSCFALQTKKVKIIIDPYSDSIGLKLPLQLTANIVLVTHNHQDHNNVEAISGNNGEKPFRITGPGEYEVSGIYFHGIGSFHDKLEGKERGLNTIYTIDDGNIRLCHLGDLGTGLSDEQLEQIGEVDILFVPVGGTYTIDVAKAVAVIGQIDPKIVIPMHYQLPGLQVDLAEVGEFLEAEGISNKEACEVYRVAKSDLPAEERDVVIFKAQNK